MEERFQIIGRIENDYDTLFGIPRQPGICPNIVSRIVFEEAYRSPEALRGIEGFSHLWLLWVFSEHRDEGWHPTVRPPKLGGNTRVGVFASRSPFRPNPIGLSVVQLLSAEADGSLLVSGADLMNGTPIIDIKPYVPYCDSIPDARGGFAPLPEQVRLPVDDPENCLQLLPPDKREAARQLLSADPRPGYASDPERVYGVAFAGHDLRFRVKEGRLILCECRKTPAQHETEENADRRNEGTTSALPI